MILLFIISLMKRQRINLLNNKLEYLFWCIFKYSINSDTDV